MRACLLALALASCSEGDSGRPEADAGGDDAAQPDVDAGRAGVIEIIIDESGIPHIYAPTDIDLFWAAGYQAASDRMLQMDMTRRRALGRWAEVLGPEGLDEDRLARVFGWRDVGRSDAERARTENAETFGLATAWVAGVNARIEEVLSGEAPLPWGYGPDALNFEPEPWDDSDPFVIGRMTGFGNDLTLDREVLVTVAERFFGPATEAMQILRPARDAFILPPDERPSEVALAPLCDPGRHARPAPRCDPRGTTIASLVPAALESLRAMGSNSWALDGRHTASGRPILAGDPHLGFDFPGILYALHLDSASSGGTFSVAGFALAGVPGVMIGQTDRLAWTPTTAFADVMDVWDAAVDEDGATVGGQTYPVQTRTETIHVRDGNDEVVECRDLAGFGIVLPDDLVPIPITDEGRSLVLGWTGYAGGAWRGILGLNRARSLDEFEAAVDQSGSLDYNMLAADATGIAYRVGVAVPERLPPTAERRAWAVLDGDDPDSAWTGAMLRPEKLPHSRAPGRGWIVTANNDPFGFTADGTLENDPWYYGAFFDPGWRAARIEAELTRLAERGDVTLGDVQALQNDVHDGMTDDLLPLLGDALARRDEDELLAPYRDRPDLDALGQLLLEDWDRDMSRDSPGAVAFHAFAHLASREVLGDDYSFLYGEAMRMQPVYILKLADLALRGEFGDAEVVLDDPVAVLLLEALDATASWLTERFGGVEPDRYRFSDMKLTSFDDALGTGMPIGEWATDGGEATVNVSPGRFYDEDGNVATQWRSRYGPLERMVAELAEDGTPELWVSFPLGNVADPASDHFQDAHDDWIEGRYRRLWFRRDEVEAHMERRIELEPRK